MRYTTNRSQYLINITRYLGNVFGWDWMLASEVQLAVVSPKWPCLGGVPHHEEKVFCWDWIFFRFR